MLKARSILNLFFIIKAGKFLLFLLKNINEKKRLVTGDMI